MGERQLPTRWWDPAPRETTEHWGNIPPPALRLGRGLGSSLTAYTQTTSPHFGNNITKNFPLKSKIFYHRGEECNLPFKCMPVKGLYRTGLCQSQDSKLTPPSRVYTDKGVHPSLEGFWFWGNKKVRETRVRWALGISWTYRRVGLAPKHHLPVF